MIGLITPYYYTPYSLAPYRIPISVYTPYSRPVLVPPIWATAKMTAQEDGHAGALEDLAKTIKSLEDRIEMLQASLNETADQLASTIESSLQDEGSVDVNIDFTLDLRGLWGAQRGMNPQLAEWLLSGPLAQMA